MSEPRENPGLEGALQAWAERQRLPDGRAAAIAAAVVQDATPDLPFEWWRTLFPSQRMRTAA